MSVKSTIIGITCDQDAGLRERSFAPGISSHFLMDDYIRAVEKRGALPLLLPVSSRKKCVEEMVELIDGLLLIGSQSDVDPSSFGREPHQRLGRINPARTRFEIELVKAAIKKEKSVLGICGGMQAINVALGGSLIQDIPSQVKGAIQHSQRGDPAPPFHTVKVEKGTMLNSIIGKERIRVNSTHHQAVERLARGLIRNAWAEDGITEGIEKPDHRFCLGVQWHPERVADKDANASNIFKAFINKAR
jgi:putative glutamine amidotransferase